MTAAVTAAAEVARVERDGDELVVTPLRGLLPELKTLGARWDQRSGTWRLPASRMNAAWLKEVVGDHGVVIDAPDGSPVVHDRLFPWQRKIVARLVAAPRGQILVAEPGLGKTVMAIVAADIAAPSDQVVVVAPAPLMGNWAREIAEWSTDPSVYKIHGADIDWEKARDARWLITSWHMLALHQDWFVDEWPLWILDESILGKSRASTFSKSVSGGKRKAKVDPATGLAEGEDKTWANLRKGVDKVWLLSGSTTSRYADDAWAQLAMIWPAAFRSYWRFAERYCVIEENRWAPGPGTVVATRRDHDVLADNADLMLVVTGDSVGANIPKYVPETIDVELTPGQREAYDEMLDSFVVKLGSLGRGLTADNKMAQLTYLQQIVTWWDGESAKHDAVVERLRRPGTFPALIWTHWVEGAEALQARLVVEGFDSVHVRGGSTQKRQDDAIEAYKRGDHDVLILALGVGKFGHTLVNTRTVLDVDKTWNADDYYQSRFRVRRIGLKHRPKLVTVRAPGTTDELLERNLEGKIEGISRMTNADLKELLLGLGR